MSGTEPSDALRVSFAPLLAYIRVPECRIPQVVNALLTQLDKLKLKRNVLIISTSNLPDAIGMRDRTRFGRVLIEGVQILPMSIAPTLFSTLGLRRATRSTISCVHA